MLINVDDVVPLVELPGLFVQLGQRLADLRGQDLILKLRLDRRERLH
ncbi:MAG TPA: hypothetical protein VES01_10910 [Dermatophilaceae bacterium]|nr:hypothetical protein [Dermatophilaceae bacterium]